MALIDFLMDQQGAMGEALRSAARQMRIARILPNAPLGLIETAWRRVEYEIAVCWRAEAMAREERLAIAEDAVVAFKMFAQRSPAELAALSAWLAAKPEMET